MYILKIEDEKGNVLKKLKAKAIMGAVHLTDGQDAQIVIADHCATKDLVSCFIALKEAEGEATKMCPELKKAGLLYTLDKLKDTFGDGEDK